jgi:hypothetical protein
MQITKGLLVKLWLATNWQPLKTVAYINRFKPLKQIAHKNERLL